MQHGALSLSYAIQTQQWDLGALTFVGASHRQDQTLLSLPQCVQAVVVKREDMREPAATQGLLHKHQYCPTALVPPSRGYSPV